MSMGRTNSEQVRFDLPPASTWRSEKKVAVLMCHEVPADGERKYAVRCRLVLKRIHSQVALPSSSVFTLVIFDMSARDSYSTRAVAILKLFLMRVEDQFRT